MRPIVWCDKHGRFMQSWPQRDDANYPADADWEVVTSRKYLLGERSLIVDAIKARPPATQFLACEPTVSHERIAGRPTGFSRAGCEPDRRD